MALSASHGGLLTAGTVTTSRIVAIKERFELECVNTAGIVFTTRGLYIHLRLAEQSKML